MAGTRNSIPMPYFFRADAVPECVLAIMV